MNAIVDITTFLGIMQATIAPAMVISGLAVLLSVMAGRYARCIDRTRELLLMLQSSEADKKNRRAWLYQLKITYKRCRQLRNMMALASASIFLVVSMITCALLSQLFSWHMEKLAAIMFVCALLFLATSLLYFVRDVVISLYGIKVEIVEAEKDFAV